MASSTAPLTPPAPGAATGRLRDVLRHGIAIPAHPLALTEERRLDERRQRALTRYYLAAGAGGVAVGVHTTQFEIRDPGIGLYRPVLELAARTVAQDAGGRDVVTVAGVAGPTAQAVGEAEIARELGYRAVLLSPIRPEPGQPLGGREIEDEMIDRARAVAEVLPVIGFYLQTAIRGPVLTYDFWRRFCEIEDVVAIKAAPFDRYRTIDVARALADSGRTDIALYTGNDDAIVADLLTTHRFGEDGTGRSRRVTVAGGLLGQWSVWTRGAVDLVERARAARAGDDVALRELVAQAPAWTDANAALFDPGNDFAGCIAGVHEVLRRQGLLAGTWCLDPGEGLSPGQAEEIDRVTRAYPWLTDDDFVARHLDDWLRP